MTIDDVRERLTESLDARVGALFHGPQRFQWEHVRALLDDHARLAAEVERARSGPGLVYEACAQAESRVDDLTAEVARLTRERDGWKADALLRAQNTEHAQTDRDRLAAALAEVREAAWLCLPDRDAILGGAERWRRLRLACEAIPADLAAARDARVRAEALREAAEHFATRAADDRGASTGPGSAWAVRAAFLDGVADRLRSEADRIERGGR